MGVKSDVSQPPTSWLETAAEENAPTMLATLDVHITVVASDDVSQYLGVLVAGFG